MIKKKIETKEAQQRQGSFASAGPQDCPHNNTTLIQNRSVGAPMNPFRVAQGVGANMEFNQGSRLGDQINVKGL